MTKEERAYNYASKCKATKFQVGEIAKFYNDGYEQAKKDLALTLEDIESIVKIADSLLTGTAWDVIDWPDEQKYYEEVLKRFKEAKK